MDLSVVYDFKQRSCKGNSSKTDHMDLWMLQTPKICCTSLHCTITLKDASINNNNARN